MRVGVRVGFSGQVRAGWVGGWVGCSASGQVLGGWVGGWVGAFVVVPQRLRQHASIYLSIDCLQPWSDTKSAGRYSYV